MPAKALATYILLGVLATLMLFTRLDDRLLWGDEAETALLAMNVVRTGLPRVDDGRNRIANMPGATDSNDSGIWIWTPWLDEYLAAASFAVLGPSTFAARVPFALLGLISVGLLAVVARRAFASDDVAINATFLYVTSVPFLLHARQCRYYAPMVLGQIWLLYGFDRALRAPGAAAAAHVAASLAVMFYCNYIALPASVIGLAAAAWMLRRRHPRLPGVLGLGGLGFALLALPWLLYSSAPGQLGQLRLDWFGANLAYYLSETHFHLVPLVVLAIPPVALLLRRAGWISDPSSPNVGRDLALALGCIAVASYAVLAVSPLRFFRYLVPLIPVWMLLTAWILDRGIRATWLRHGVVVALGLSNVIAIGSGYGLAGDHRFDLPFVRFTGSITREYRDRLEDVVRFFEEHAEPDDTAYVRDPEFPLVFYTNLRVIDARYRRTLRNPPDWILPRSPSGVAEAALLSVPPRLANEYELFELEVRKTRRGASRPDPDAHVFFTTTEFESFPLYRRRSPADPDRASNP